MDGYLALSKQVRFFKTYIDSFCLRYVFFILQVALIEALKEIQAHDPEFDKILSSDYKYILTNAEKLKAAHKRQPNYLDRLYGMPIIKRDSMHVV